MRLHDGVRFVSNLIAREAHMARKARGESLDPHSIQIVHAISRCVRQAFLCGYDKFTEQSFEHRRGWILQRLEFQASLFGIDCLTFSVMNNHYHLILRSRPDVVADWGNEEVACRWLTLCPPGGEPFTEIDLAMLLNNPSRLAEIRTRLSDVSWWMRLQNQIIARRANEEENRQGRFWEGRFTAQVLLDEAAILACAMYVDLNPIRAATAESLEDSEFTGAKTRIDDLKEDVEQKTVGIEAMEKQSNQSTGTAIQSIPQRPTCLRERDAKRKRSGWLSPVEIDELRDPTGPDKSQCGRRASRKGFLSMPLAKYLELLDWTGRQLRVGKRGAIPQHIVPILQKIGIRSERWFDLASKFTKLFRKACGSKISLSIEANQRNQSWMHAPGADAFT